MKKVSIIVPVYNIAEEYLSACIESILSQEYKNIELLLINDGSTNGIEKVCEDADRNDERVKYIYQENQGVSVARNTGLDNASGDYILFVDGDDYISRGMLSDIVAHMQNNNEPDILFFGYCTNYTNREIRRVLENHDPELFKTDNLIMAILRGDSRLGPVEVSAPWGKLVKRSIVEENNLRYTKGLLKGQDTTFTLNLLQFCNRMIYVPVAGYHYRMSAASISHRYNPDIIRIMEKTLDAFTEAVMRYSKQSGGNVDYSLPLALKRYRVMMNEYLDLYFIHKNNPKSSREMKKEFLELTRQPEYKTIIDKVSEYKMSGIEGIEYKLLRAENMNMLWLMRKAMYFCKGLIIKNFG